MPQNIKIQINPDVLRWAREESGFTSAYIAHKLNITIERYSGWENSGQNIPLGMLKKVANYCKRQLAVFLLPTPPPKTKRPPRLSQPGHQPGRSLSGHYAGHPTSQ